MAEETEVKNELIIPCECGHSLKAHTIVEGRCWVGTKIGKKRYNYCYCTGGYHQMDNLDFLVYKKDLDAKGVS